MMLLIKMGNKLSFYFFVFPKFPMLVFTFFFLLSVVPRDLHMHLTCCLSDLNFAPL